MRGELLGEAGVSRVRLGDHQKTRGALVEAVHDPRPLDAADAGEAVPAMSDERVDERARRVPGGRVYDEVRRLVDDDEGLILVDDVERDGLGCWSSRLRLRYDDVIHLARFDPPRPVFYCRASRIRYVP